MPCLWTAPGDAPVGMNSSTPDKIALLRALLPPGLSCPRNTSIRAAPISV